MYIQNHDLFGNAVAFQAFAMGYIKTAVLIDRAGLSVKIQCFHSTEYCK